jgi:hypothetical protein
MRWNERVAAREAAVIAGVMAVSAGLLAAFASAADPHNHVLRMQLGIAAVVFGAIALLCYVTARRLAALRQLGAVQRAGLLEELSETPFATITVIAPRGDHEAVGYARQILAVLRDAGWLAEGQLDDAQSDTANAGICVAVAKEHFDQPPTEATLLLRALQRVGIPATLGTSKRLHGVKTVDLYVGRRG